MWSGVIALPAPARRRPPEQQVDLRVRRDLLHGVEREAAVEALRDDAEAEDLGERRGDAERALRLLLALHREQEVAVVVVVRLLERGQLRVLCAAADERGRVGEALPDRAVREVDLLAGLERRVDESVVRRGSREQALVVRVAEALRQLRPVVEALVPLERDARELLGLIL